MTLKAHVCLLLTSAHVTRESTDTATCPAAGSCDTQASRPWLELDNTPSLSNLSRRLRRTEEVHNTHRCCKPGSRTPPLRPLLQLREQQQPQHQLLVGARNLLLRHPWRPKKRAVSIDVPGAEGAAVQHHCTACASRILYYEKLSGQLTLRTHSPTSPSYSQVTTSARGRAYC